MSETPRTAPPRRVVLVTATAALFVIAWVMLHANTSAAATRCAREYRAARTAADTAAVDALVPERAPQAGGSQSTCAMLRTSARWR